VTDHLSRFLPSQRLTVLWSLVLSALPAATEPCALEVSHSLDALLPNEPSEPISSRSRSQGFALQGIIPQPAANTLPFVEHPFPPWPSTQPLSRPCRTSGVFPLARSRPFREVIHLADPAIPFLGFLFSEASCTLRRPPALNVVLPTPARRMHPPLLRFFTVAFSLTTVPALQGLYRLVRNASLSRCVQPP
jgi:hypothetical protein